MVRHLPAGPGIRRHRTALPEGPLFGVSNLRHLESATYCMLYAVYFTNAGHWGGPGSRAVGLPRDDGLELFVSKVFGGWGRRRRRRLVRPREVSRRLNFQTSSPDLKGSANRRKNSQNIGFFGKHIQKIAIDTCPRKVCTTRSEGLRSVFVHILAGRSANERQVASNAAS